MPIPENPSIETMKSKRDVRGLIKALETDNVDSVRQAAAQALGEIGDARAVEYLTSLFEDQNWQLRFCAVQALGRIGDEAAVSDLRRLIEYSYLPFDPTIYNRREIRKLAIWAIKEIGGEEAAMHLTELLQSDDAEMRSTVADALATSDLQIRFQEISPYYLISKMEWEKVAELGSPAVEPLICVLNDQEMAVRKGAAEALGKIGDLLAQMPLIKKLNDKEWEVRQAAVLALGQIGGNAVIKPLISKLEDKHNAVSVSAWNVLIEIGRPAVKPLIAALDSSKPQVIRAAARALGEIGDKRAVPPLVTKICIHLDVVDALVKFGSAAVEPLVNALSGDTEKQQSAIEALGRIGDQRAVLPLIAALDSATPQVIRAAARALGKIGDNRAIAPLIAKMSIHHDVVNSLAKFGSAAVEPLVNALQGKNIEAVRALGEIADQRAVAPLINSLHYSRLRAASISALTKFGLSAVQPLLGAINDKHPLVRRSAAEVLGRVGNNQVTPFLVSMLTDENENVQEAVVLALETLCWHPEFNQAGAIYYAIKHQWNKILEIGSQAIEPLIRQLSKNIQKLNEIYLRSESWQYKGVLNYRNASFEKDWIELIDYLRALNQLGWQPDDEQIMAFYWIIQKQWELCEKAGLPAVEALIIALRNVALEEQVVIVGILGEIGDRRAVFPLINRLRAFGGHKRSLMTMEKALHERVKRFDPLAAYMDDDSPSHRSYHYDLNEAVEKEKELDITQKEIERVNNQILFIETTLGKITGEAIGSDPDLWEVWWLEQTDIVK